jgi:EmrB/QacA subfamily drug resistance transporter
LADIVDAPAQVAAPVISPVIPLVIACGLFMAQLDSTIIATSIPQMAQSLGVSPLRLNIAITSYLITLAVFVPISGWLADRFGPRRVFCAALILFTCGSMACGLSVNFGMLVATRVLQGMGGAMMTPVGRLILIRTYPKDQLITAMAYASIPALIGPTIGPLVGGFLTTYASWRWIFYINLPIGILGVVLTLRYIRNFTTPPPPAFDFRGFFMVGIGLGLLAVGIEYLGRHMLAGWELTALFVAAAISLSAYVWHTGTVTDPVLDLRLFKLPTFRTATVTGGFSRFAIGSVPFLLPLLLQVGFGLDPLQSGLLTFVTSLGQLLNKTMVRAMLRQFGFRNLLSANSLVLGLMIGGLALFTAQSPHWLLWVYLIAYGFVRSVQFTSVNALTYSDLTPAIMSKGTSLASVVQQLCMSFGVAIAASLLMLNTGATGHLEASDFRPVFLIIGVLPLLATIGFLRLPPRSGAHVSGHRAGAAAGVAD